MKTMISALFMVVLAACSSDSSGPVDGKKHIVKGRRLTASEAVAVLSSSDRWCYGNSDDDAFFGTHTFNSNGGGEFAVWNRIESKFHSKDPMAWKISDDLLVMTLPANFKPNVWRSYLRFDGHDIQLWENENSLRAVLEACNLPE